jgi:pyrimidine operon attenuation protein/uracil phosphoribosyltransferase
MSNRTVLMNAADIDRALSRIAHQVLEYTAGRKDLALVGIHTRGAPLARRLAAKIARAGEETPPVGMLDINLYRDDLSLGGDHPVVRRTELPFRVAEREVVLVDDVLFTGRTIRAAMDALIDLGRPRAIRLAVLVDRGARELPIQPDFCGRSVTVAPNQEIVVRLSEIDGGPDQVTLLSKAQAESQRRRAARRIAVKPAPAKWVPRAHSARLAVTTPPKQAARPAGAKGGRRAPARPGGRKGGRR